MKTNTISSSALRVQFTIRSALHAYYQRHSMEIFSDYSLSLDITCLFLKLKKSRQIDILNFHIET